MRLLSFDTPANPVVRIGIAVTVGGADYIIDAGEAYRLYLSQTMNEGLARRTAAALVPADMAHLLAGGDDSARALRALTTYAGSALDSAEGTAEWAASGRLHRWGDVRLAPPVPDPSKILAIGANYPDGAASPTGPAPDPVVFAKLPSGLVPSGAEVALPPGCTDLDYEGELAVVIGRSCHLVAVGDALDAVAGYTIINDLTRRELLAGERTRGHIMFGKNFAGAAPCGPVLVTADEFGDPAAATLSTWVNGQLRQQSSVAAMLHGVADLVAFCSRVPLQPGDLIATGSPKIALAPDAPKYLSAGDELTVRITGLGSLTTTVTAGPATSGVRS